MPKEATIEEKKEQGDDKSIYTSNIAKEFENIGVIHYWGLSPCIDFLDQEFDKKEINVLLC